jgi:FMN phosphatase YigB (HAD superfamily)
LPERRICVFDIDGTLCDNSLRIARLNPADPDWDEFHETQVADPPLEAQVALLRLLHEAGYIIVIMTNRSREHHYGATMTWLRKHNIPMDYLHMRHPEISMSVYKKSMLEDILNNVGPVSLVVDDDPNVIEQARELGIPALYIMSNYYDKSTWGTALVSKES